MKHLVFVFITLFVAIGSGISQKYFTKTGQVSFSSETPMEKIEGINKSVNLVLDAATGKMEIGILVKGFQFEKALMQEHFNENYMESSKFPKSTFKGQIENFSALDLTKNNKYTVKVTGDLTVHGVTKNISTEGMIVVNNGVIDANADFEIALGDYGISIPSLVKENISKVVKIKVKTSLKPLK